MNTVPAKLMHALRRPSGAWLALLVLALLARGLIGPGFMPQFGREGISVVLCTPQGAKSVPAEGLVAHQAGDAQCVFGMALAMAGLPAAAPGVFVRATVEAPQFFPATPAAATTARPYSARGPPSYS